MTISTAAKITIVVNAIEANKGIEDSHTHGTKYKAGAVAVLSRDGKDMIVFVMKDQLHSINLIEVLDGIPYISTISVFTMLQSVKSFHDYAATFSDVNGGNPFAGTILIAHEFDFSA